MRIESLSLFLSVAEHRSISRAAQQNFISQQGASSTIKALEQDFGVKLFDRSGSHLQLTPAGKRLAHEAEKVLRAYRDLQLAVMMDAFDPTESNTLSVVTAPFVTNRLATIFSEFELLAPNVHVNIIERNPSDIMADYQNDAPDVLHIVPLPSFETPESKTVRSNYEPLIALELMMSCSWDSAYAELPSITRKELCAIPFAYYSEEFLTQLVTYLFEGMTPDIRLCTSNLAMLDRCLEHSGAVTLIDSLTVFADRHEAASMAAVPIEDSVGFSIGILGTPPHGSLAQQFVAFFKRYLSTAYASYMKHYPITKA